MVSEKEKMLNNEPYYATDETLLKERLFIKDKIYDYNLLKPSLVEERKKQIKNIIGKTGENIWVESPFQCDYGYNIEVGDNFYSNHNLVILDVSKVVMGKNVFIGPNVGIYTAGHPIDAKIRATGLEFGKPVYIGNDVWIGGNVVILPGVNIGDNVVIGAGSVIVKDIPSNCVAVGNPCKVVKELT